MLRRALLAASLVLVLSTVAAAHPGSGVVVDPRGRVFFTDLRQVWRADPDGTLSVAVPGTHTHEIVLDPDGAVRGEHVAYDAPNDRWLARFWRLAPGGRLEELVPLTASPPEGWGLLRDAGGTFYSVRQNNNERRETLLLRRAPDGHVSVLAGGAYGRADGAGAAARFESIGGLAWGPDGALYVTDGRSVRRVTRDGSATTLVDELPLGGWLGRSIFGSNANSLMGLAVAPSGEVFVADLEGRCVWRVGPGGVAERFDRSEPLWAPTGVAVDGDALLVLEYGKDVRVRRVTRGGESSTVATVAGGLVPPPTGLSLDVLFVGVSLLAAGVGALALLWRRARRGSGEIAKAGTGAPAS